MTTTLDDLIARVEAATEGSRELDELIWFLSNTDPDADQNNGHPPPYTTSIDAARALKRGRWVSSSYVPETGKAAAAYWGDEETMPVHADANTEPLACCAAALKARREALR